MQKIVYAIFFTTLTFTCSLKLLVNDDYVEDDDEAWESDIQFSYKPLAGKCDIGAPMYTRATAPGYTPGIPANEYYRNTAKCITLSDSAPPGTGCMTKLTCADFPDAAKYCTFPAITDTGLSASRRQPATTASSKLDDVMWGMQQFSKNTVPEWKLSKFAHYVAKLASMGNTKIPEDHKNERIESFDIKKTKSRARFYRGAATAVTANEDYLCYTKIMMAWAKNDPKVKNIDGEEFEIMATGTFSLLSLKASSTQKAVFTASATVDRAGTRCGATYIQNLTLSGQWVEDTGVASIEIKAEAAVPKNKALRVNFAGEWQPATSKLSYAAVQKADGKEIILQLNKLKVLASVDSHRIHEQRVKTKRFANFLNVNFEGISTLSGISVNGLLGRDAHAYATQLPDGCESEKLAAFIATDKKAMLSSVKIE